MKHLFLTYALLVGFLEVANGQTLASRYQEAVGDWHTGVNVMLTRYGGDLNDRYDINHLQISWGAEGHIRYRFDERFSIRGDVGFYRLRGDQRYSQNAGNYLRFTTVNPSVLAGIQWNIRSIDYNQNNIPYIWLSTGLTHLNPKTDYKGGIYSLPELQTEGKAYPRTVGQLVLGAGIPFVVTRKSLLQLEARYTFIFSDYVDDVSTTYVNKASQSALTQVLADRRIEYGTLPNVPGAQRGNPSKNDGYFALSLLYSYQFRIH